MRRMHDAYAGKWFRTLTFVQTTTFPQAPGGPRVVTWYEATRAPSTLRIDVGDPVEGNGLLYRGDSTYRFRAGKLVIAVPQGNPLLPFVVGLYHQPVEETLRQLAGERFDMARVRAATWAGRRTFVVGAREAADTLAPQFWVDAERLVLVRLIGIVPGDTTKRLEVRMADYQPLGGGWIAPRVEIMVDGALVQKEEYAEMRADVALDDALFEPGQWGKVAHWRK